MTYTGRDMGTDPALDEINEQAIAELHDDGPDWDSYDRAYRDGVKAVNRIVEGYARAARAAGELDAAVLLEGIVDKASRLNPMTDEVE